MGAQALLEGRDEDGLRIDEDASEHTTKRETSGSEGTMERSLYDRGGDAGADDEADALAAKV
jgi:hypothetical protein